MVRKTGPGCLLIAVAGWMNQMIDYLREENRFLREQLDGRRLRINDDQRPSTGGYPAVQGENSWRK
jgi:hypothetical protein